MRQLYQDLIDYLGQKNEGISFDYRFLRGAIGAVAFALPIIVFFRSDKLFELSSISHSYYTPAIDFFVGILFFVCAFLIAYKGHTKKENLASSLAAFAALGVAIFPTDEIRGNDSLTGDIHAVAAIIMFSILAYFCLSPFAKGVQEKIDNSRQGDTKISAMKRRRRTYLFCGWAIILIMVSYAITNLISPNLVWKYKLLFWAEAFSLMIFGIAWSVAAKYLPYMR
ncbi:DUF998 domain-containing protein [Gracilimonas sp.]|uniref:DUF998 domain-containing protein n=1 Tax=Gracilimonas sp. TaxID=1974203 RepID=UPI0032F00902